MNCTGVASANCHHPGSIACTPNGASSIGSISGADSRAAASTAQAVRRASSSVGSTNAAPATRGEAS